jgi:hypothetical protein
MSDASDVISAFLDDEPFDPGRLAEALGDPAGRDLLLDLIALRHLTQTDEREAAAFTAHASTRSALRPALAAAAVLVALAGGYLAGGYHREMALSAAPPATRVVPAPGAWQEIPLGRMR